MTPMEDYYEWLRRYRYRLWVASVIRYAILGISAAILAVVAWGFIVLLFSVA